MKIYYAAPLLVSLLLSAVVFVLCGADKLFSMRGMRRIPERIFFILSALGGAPGLCFGMIAFHHKTSHWRFRLCAVLFGMLWLSLSAAILLWTGGFI